MRKRVQTEHVDSSDRLKAVKPFLYFCTALGLLPVAVSVTKTGHGKNMVSSKQEIITDLANIMCFFYNFYENSLPKY